MVQRRGHPARASVTEGGEFSATWVDNRWPGPPRPDLIDEWLGDSPASVLVTLSSNAFRGEEKREMVSR